MDRDAVFLRIVWPLLWMAMYAGGVLDFGLEVLADHWDLPIVFLIGSFVPYALFRKVHERARTPAARTASLVCGTLALGLLAGVCIAFPFSIFQPIPGVALVYVGWTLPLFVFVLPTVAIDYFAARAEAARAEAEAEIIRAE